MFDWLGFLDSRRISYVEKGKNVGKGRVAVKCPFCGSADPSEHMGIRIDGSGWGCLRNRAHRGRSPVKLVAALTGLTLDQARSIVGIRTFLPYDFADTVRSKLSKTSDDTLPPLIMPKEFKPLRVGNVLSRPYINYLIRFRRLHTYRLASLCERFDLRFATSGEFAGRIIFPVYHDGILVSWTGRAIGHHPIRYKAHSQEGYPPITDYLLWHDDLYEADADTIYLVEGPFDALKIWALGELYGIVATCFFTSEPSAAQLTLLHDVLPMFKHRFVLTDSGTLSTPLRLSLASEYQLKARHLPKTIKDPGEINDVKILLP